jgi:hypothetical protein
MTTRAGIRATITVGREIRPVTRVAAELGIGWFTVMDTVRLFGNWLIADPHHLAGIHALEVDETKFLTGTRERRTSWVTAICDVARRFVADIVEQITRLDVSQPKGPLSQEPREIRHIKRVRPHRRRREPAHR